MKNFILKTYLLLKMKKNIEYGICYFSEILFFEIYLFCRLLYGEQPSLSGSGNSGSASAGTGAGADRSAPVYDPNLLPQHSQQPYQHNHDVPQPPPNGPIVELPNDQVKSLKMPQNRQNADDVSK